MSHWSAEVLAAALSALVLVVGAYAALRLLAGSLSSRRPGRLRRHLLDLLQDPTHEHEAREARRRAVEINDDIVQGLTVAKYALELGHTGRATAAVDRALASSRSIISDLLGEQGTVTRLGPGDLVRQEAALRELPSPAVSLDDAARRRDAG